jgi:hypothetical protein
MSSPAVSGASPARSLAIVNPASEKTHSDGAEVVGVHSSRWAKCDRRGNFNSFTFHHVKGQLKEQPFSVPSTLYSLMGCSCQ